MQKLLLQISQNSQMFAIGGAIVILLLSVFILARMNRQLKKLNCNFGIVASRMQEYFEVIMNDDEESEKSLKRDDVYLTKEEREILLAEPYEKKEDDEQVFNSVLQEYFS